jgi:archaellum biogenesis ATPase FlaH
MTTPKPLETECKIINLMLRYPEVVAELQEKRIGPAFFAPKHEQLVQAIYSVQNESDGKRSLTDEHFRNILIKQGGKGDITTAMQVWHECMYGVHHSNSKEDLDLLRSDLVNQFVHREGVRALQDFNDGVCKSGGGYVEATKRYADDLNEIVVYSEPNSLKVTTLADVESESIQWLWPGRIALGKLTIIVGDPGLGKSFVSIDIAARVSTGKSFPQNAGVTREPGDVILIADEDGLADTIRPRLDAHGADVSKVHAIETHDRTFSFADDLGALEHLLKSKPNTKLIIIDPLNAYMGGKVDCFKDKDVRSTLTPVAKLAERHGVAIVGIMHSNKTRNVNAIHKVTGAVAYTGQARSVWMIMADVADPKRRLFLFVKNNNYSDPGGLAFTIDDGRIQWSNTIEHLSADDVLKDRQPKSPRDEAKEWIYDALSDGQRESTELLEQAKSEGIAEATLKRAKGEMNISSPRIDNKWYWKLNENKNGQTQGDQ